MSLKGTEIEIMIEQQEFGGKAIGYHDGKKIITNHGIVGQVVLIRIKKVKQSYMEGIIIKVLKKSRLETEIVCPHFKSCGGCSMQGVEYSEQVKLKEEHVKHLFEDKEIEVGEWLPTVSSRRENHSEIDTI